MASTAAGLQALSQITQCYDIRTYQLVLLLNEKDLKSAVPFPANSKYVDDSLSMSLVEEQGQVAYLCTTKSRLFILGQSQIREKSYKDKVEEVEKREGNEDTEMVEKEENILKEPAKTEMEAEALSLIEIDELNEAAVKRSASSGLLFDTKLEDIDRVIMHRLLADRFGILMKRDYHGPCGFVALSSCHRKVVVEDIQISYNTAMMYSYSQLKNLRTEFLEAGARDDALTEFRHPTLLMYNALPNQLKEGQKPFYRCGYIFLGPEKMQDTSQLSSFNLNNRYVSTYQWPGEEASGEKVPAEDIKHLIFRIMPERPFGPSAQNSNLDFHLWVESIAWSIAEAEDSKHLGTGSFFVPEQGIYRKKLNIVQDEAMYHCFRMHLSTKTREIGVIGVRRKFIPPQIDTFQDMIFILKGPKQKSEKRSNEPLFMQCLERIVDSLSPTVMDWKRDSTWVLDPSVTRSKEAHPTYIDRFMIETQVNALLCSHEVYSWLKNRPAFKIKPTKTFGGQTIFALAEHFCKSILKVAGQHVKTNVKDPLFIIKRIDIAAGEMIAPASKAVRKMLLHNWKWRVSAYFAHMVESYAPEQLTIQSLARTVIEANMRGLSEEDTQVLNRVIAFLSFFHEEGKTYSQPESLLEIIEDKKMLSNLSCNEFVLTKLLQTPYFERLCPKDGEEYPGFLQHLLFFKSENLELLRVVCRKARHVTRGYDLLIKPLIRLARGGNTYAQTYALQALRHIASKKGNKTRAKEMRELGGIDIAIDILHTTPSRDLLQAAIMFLQILIEKEGRLIGRATHQSTLDKVVSLLGHQVLKQRHDASILSAVSTLVMKICSEPGILYYLVLNGMIKELMEIVGDDRNYFHVLVAITATLGTAFFHLSNHGNKFPDLLLKSSSELNEYLPSQAEVLVRTLKHCTTKEGLMMGLNILIILNHILDTDVLKKLDDYNKGSDALKLRRQILSNLVENHGFEHALIQAKTTANNVQGQIANPNDKKGKLWTSIIAGVEQKTEMMLHKIKERDALSKSKMDHKEH
eukprot:CAMPEP_0114514900 /NCGR_PEP_ID=MMETSP0109-20121206/16417_1 /TAXON_ID=29199 /ORGANISM="Chlorarachnion reptans, Strain CCCM449" /LENGTH=1026 /DNA_ID=CAMNT_0001695005 /DNA_START=20 /DNA_END=3100 /DNA_ORIENTATION=-